jgi:protein SCO1/2
MSWIVVVGLLGLAVAAGRGRASGDDLPYYDGRDFTPRWSATSHRLGAFSLLSQTGAAFTDRDLAGRVHVASFIYTRCSAICPTLVANLRRVDRAVADSALRFVAYSVTPDLDPPGVLADFGREHSLDPARWTLVTGDKSQIYRLARESYFADDDRIRATIAEPGAFLHTEKVVLVDRDGRLRGVYDATQSFDMDKLIEDATRLLANPA